MKLARIDWRNKHEVIRAAEYMAKTDGPMIVLNIGTNYSIIPERDEHPIVHRLMVVHRTP